MSIISQHRERKRIEFEQRRNKRLAKCKKWKKIQRHTSSDRTIGGTGGGRPKIRRRRSQ
jgi:hypothetical protein